MAYEQGDTVVHPRHGVATVRAVSTRGSGASQANFLQLVFPAGSLEILVPVDAVDEIGLRTLPSTNEVAAVLEVLTEPSDVPVAWAERSAASSRRMQSGELTQVAMVIRDLTRHAQRSGKPLSTTERAVLQTCLDSVSSELAIVLGISHDDACALVLEKAHAAA